MGKILVLDGSLHGKDGNTSVLIRQLLNTLGPDIQADYLELRFCKDIVDEENRFREADGFIFGTGTYWQSWSHHAQRFFEQVTSWESTDIWLGKPVCSIVTMHSVGGMGVLARLQSNFSLFGAVIPPMCCIVHSYVNRLAQQNSSLDGGDEDIWDERSLPTIAHNFIEAVRRTHNYRSWQVDSDHDSHGKWL